MSDAKFSDEALKELATELGRRLSNAHKTISTVESCTGGWIAKALTDVPGSSQWFGYGWVTYSNNAKQDLIGVATDTLSEQGAVSEAVVAQMARGALDEGPADIALSVSGVAGPDGGSVRKPVGMVCFGQASRAADKTIQFSAQTQQFDGDREQIRRQTVLHALNLAIAALDS